MRLLIVYLLFTVSCTESERNSSQTSKNINLNEDSLAPSVEINSIHIDTPIQPKINEPHYHKPVTSFETYPELKRNIFSYGSNRSELLEVQGRPELIENQNTNNEVWYYGNTEIHFSDGLVSMVKNPTPAIKYIPVSDLMFSESKIEEKFGIFLFERALQIGREKITKEYDKILNH